MIEWIKKDLDATSLKYQLLDDMVKAIGLPKDRLCLYCWNGKGQNYYFLIAISNQYLTLNLDCLYQNIKAPSIKLNPK